MNKIVAVSLVYAVGMIGAHGQVGSDLAGIPAGPFLLRPEAEALAAYDNRVVREPAEEDYYTEGSVGLHMQNQPAIYRFSAYGNYGYRSYSEYSEIDDDFYQARASLGTDEAPFTWGLSASHRKSLNYNTRYDSATGEAPDPILDARENIRTLVAGNVAYEAAVSERMSVKPQYQVQHYDQEFEDPVTGATEETEWQIHRGIVELRRRQSEKTVFLVGGEISFQANRDEDGYIATAYVGGESRLTEKTSWEARVGVSAADYETSGSDVAGVSELQANWDATEKISTYVFGGNRFMPGYNDGSARLVYRLGYGVDWSFIERWSLGARVLHDYEEELGSGATSIRDEELRSFLDVGLDYDLMESFRVTLNGRYVNDEADEDQTVVSLGVAYRY